MRAAKSEYYVQFMDSLRDEKGKARIESRVMNLCNGNAGDAEPVGEGVSELRIHYGPGYRECHVGPDWLLVYRKNEDALTLLLKHTFLARSSMERMLEKHK